MTTLAKFRLNGLGYVLLAMLGLSIAPTLVKFGITANDAPIPLLAMRLLVGALILWAFVFATRPDLVRIDQHGLRACILIALTNSVSLSCFYLGLQYINASVATIIFAAHPVVVVLIMMTRGEPLTQRKIVRIVLAFIGLILLVGISGAIRWQGVAFISTTALFYAVYLILIQELFRNYPPQQTTPYVISFMAGILLVASLLLFRDRFSFSAEGWGVILATGVFSTAIARYALFAGVKHLGSSQTALLAPIETLLTIFWAVLLLGERLNFWQMLGAGFILLSAALMRRR